MYIEHTGTIYHVHCRGREQYKDKRFLFLNEFAKEEQDDDVI